MRSKVRCSSREAARFAISKHCRARTRHSLGSPGMAPIFLYRRESKALSHQGLLRLPDDDLSLRLFMEHSESEGASVSPAPFGLGDYAVFFLRRYPNDLAGLEHARGRLRAAPNFGLDPQTAPCPVLTGQHWPVQDSAWRARGTLWDRPA